MFPRVVFEDLSNCSRRLTYHSIASDSRFEIRGFLPKQLVEDAVESDDFWAYEGGLMQTHEEGVTQTLTGQQSAWVFNM